MLNASAAGDSSYPDPKKTKLTDGVEATADYLDAPGPPIRKAPYREFVIDLGEICSVSEVEFNNLSNDWHCGQDARDGGCFFFQG